MRHTHVTAPDWYIHDLYLGPNLYKSKAIRPS